MVEIVKNTIADPQTRMAVEASVIAGLIQREPGDWKACIEELASEPTIIISFSGPDSLDNCRFQTRDAEHIRSWIASVTIVN